MRIARPIPVIVFSVALAAYGFDCPATATPDEAMQCCDTMPCSPHGHDGSQDCCQTMQAAHAPFVKQSPSQGAQISFVPLDVLPGISGVLSLDFSQETFLATRSHAPPISPPAVLPPLRV